MISPILLIGLKFLSGDPMLWKYQAAACTLCYREAFFGSCGDLARMAILGGEWLICLVQESPFRGIYGGHMQLRRLVKQDANHCWAVIQVQAVSFLILRDRRPQMSKVGEFGRWSSVSLGSARVCSCWGSVWCALCRRPTRRVGELGGGGRGGEGGTRQTFFSLPTTARRHANPQRAHTGLASSHEQFLHPIWSEDHRSAEANMVEVVRAWDSTASG